MCSDVSIVKEYIFRTYKNCEFQKNEALHFGFDIKKTKPIECFTGKI